MKFIQNFIILSIYLLTSVLSFKTYANMPANYVMEPVLSFGVDKKNNEFFKCCCFNPTRDVYELSCHTRKDGQIVLNVDLKISPNDPKNLLNKGANEQLIATIELDKSSGIPKILHQMPLVSVSSKSGNVLTCSFVITPEQHTFLKHIASHNSNSCDDITVGIHKSGANFNDVLSYFKHLVGHFEVKPSDLMLNTSM